MAHDAVAQRVADAPRRGERLVEADGHREHAGQLRVGDEVGRRQRLLDAQHVEVGQAAQHRDVLGARAGRSRWRRPGARGPGWSARTARTGSSSHPGSIFSRTRAAPARTAASTSCAQRAEVVARRGCRRRRRRPSPRSPRPTAEGLGQRSAPRPAARRRPPPSRRRRPASGRPASSRRAAAPPAAAGSWPPRAARRPRRGGARPARPRPAPRSSSGGIDRGALGQGGALAPALALLGDDPHEEQRPHPVHAGGGADVLAEREVDPDELDAGELHGAGAPTPPP